MSSSYSQNKIQFQGQERQTGFDLGWYHFKYRMHDPAIGRFGMVDPLADKYSYNSTYAFSENRLTDGVELEGLEVYLNKARIYEFDAGDRWYNWGGVSKFVPNIGFSDYNSFVDLWNYSGDLDKLNKKWSYSSVNNDAFGKIGSDAKDVGLGLYNFADRPVSEIGSDLGKVFSNPHTY
ncbi:MAG: hypothetical protein DI538_19880 [Azospira oryzae]|nr:MAG: hypothetical protein DI538_19880 [Azospira oryzae]